MVLYETKTTIKSCGPLQDLSFVCEVRWRTTGHRDLSEQTSLAVFAGMRCTRQSVALFCTCRLGKQGASLLYGWTDRHLSVERSLEDGWTQKRLVHFCFFNRAEWPVSASDVLVIPSFGIACPCCRTSNARVHLVWSFWYLLCFWTTV